MRSSPRLVASASTAAVPDRFPDIVRCSSATHASRPTTRRSTSTAMRCRRKPVPESAYGRIGSGWGPIGGGRMNQPGGRGMEPRCTDGTPIGGILMLAAAKKRAYLAEPAAAPLFDVAKQSNTEAHRSPARCRRRPERAWRARQGSRRASLGRRGSMRHNEHWPAPRTGASSRCSAEAATAASRSSKSAACAIPRELGNPSPSCAALPPDHRRRPDHRLGLDRRRPRRSARRRDGTVAGVALSRPSSCTCGTLIQREPVRVG